MSFTVVDAPDRDAIHRALAAELFGVFGVDAVHVCEVTADRSGAEGTCFMPRPDGTVEVGDHYAVGFDRPSGVARVVETGKPLNVTDAGHSPAVSAEMVSRFRAASVLYMPLAYLGTVRAVIVLVSETSRWFREEEIDFAYTLANQASAGLGALETRRRLAGQLDRQAALARAARALNERLDQRAVLDTMCHEATVALGADLAGAYLGDAREGGLAVAGYGISDDSDWWGYRIAPGEGVAGKTLSSGEPAITNDYQSDPCAPGVDVLQRVETAVSVPMSWNGALRGALSVAFLSVRPVENQDIETLQALASLAAVACRNAEAFEEATVAARTDSLTGLLNHGAIQVRTSEEIWRAQRDKAPLACLLADLDNFKPVNDRHGHLVGDEILQRVAAALAAEFRPYDGIARYGGDEFVVLLPGSDRADALRAAERLRACVSEAAGGFPEVGMPLSASVGVSQWGEPQTASELLDRADRALLLAKRRGKDGLVVASGAAELELAQLEQSTEPSDLMDEFWNLISSFDDPQQMLLVLAPFLRRELDLEEVALYEAAGDLLGRVSTDGNADTAFAASTLAPAAQLVHRLGSGSVSRGSLAELWDALGVTPPDEPGHEPGGSYAAVALAQVSEGQGVLLLRHPAGEFPRTTLRLAQIVAAQTGTVLAAAGSGSRAAVAALAAAIDARDSYTHSHSEDVVELAGAVAERLGLTDPDVAHVRDGALLHDVGKVAIPHDILGKRGPLDGSEWKVMREHPVIGERILRRTPELAAIAPLVRHEHERWDGQGYPDGLAGEAIPVGSRIILACDAYNAMITARPYRDPMSHAEALEELRRGAGTQFDPAVVDALIEELALRGEPAVATSSR
jgi:diguanylate cyclase (GGDEF)-like protein/putative nucleotidyltransferase with HDIG domain